jgi:hypothetical protein
MPGAYVEMASLYNYAIRGQGNSAKIVAAFLRALLHEPYTFALSDLMHLDATRHAQCLAVLHWLRDTDTDLRQQLGGAAAQVTDDLQRPSLVTAPNKVDKDRWLCPNETVDARFVGVQSSAGLRNVVLQVARDREDASPTGLHLSARDSVALTEALLATQAAAWDRRHGPIDRKHGEIRPAWLGDSQDARLGSRDVTPPIEGMNALVMPAPAEAIVTALRHANVPCLIVGAYAVRFHGHARPTRALDLWTSPDAGNLEAVSAALVRLALPIKHAQLVTLEVTQARVVLHNAVTLTTGIPGLQFGAALARADIAYVRGIPCPVLSLSDLYRSKRGSRRTQDIEDIDILSAGSVFDDTDDAKVEDV